MNKLKTILAWRTPKGHVYKGKIVREHKSGAVTVFGTHALQGGKWKELPKDSIEFRAHKSTFKKPEEFIHE